MNFLDIVSQGDEALKILYKDDNISEYTNFHIDEIKIDRGSISFRTFLPMPKNPSKKLIQQEKNIASLGVDILIDGKLEIKKFYIDKYSLDGLEFFKVKVIKLDEKRYKIYLDSNDKTSIYIETSHVSVGIGFQLVEDWFVEKINAVLPETTETLPR
jgi:hypothetical protein